MSEAVIDIRLERSDYRPGEELAGAFVLEGGSDELRTLELSVLWHTEGRGNEDLGVVHYEEWGGDRPFDATRPHAFVARLPRTPHSYDGVIVKIHWCVRLRVRWVGGGETLRECAFRLGDVTAVRETEA
jgi:hypothetical protein